ncbi:hypothetical protein DH2020_047701 [Rehmannia glutinosa]|uniref:ethanolamine-phosphate cytidylyltransferase n=1 Tax=Rehmannia glutinosa TaxID=99300 RepID=A0ABR0U8C0_REHGL
MGSEGDNSQRILATWLIGGLVIGVSLLGFRFALPQSNKKKKRPIRVYMDGCFDMMHYGHCNALRQARALGDQLVVGVVSDAEIIANKGPPVTPLNERMIMVSAVKWVDEVIPDAPYAITEDFMRKLFDEYNIDYIIHGDDPCVLPDGTDAYALAKKVGRYKQIKRTEGVSSTDIVGRMLLCVRERSTGDKHSHSSLQRQFSHGHSHKSEDGGSGSGTRISHFLPTSRRIVQFSNGKVFWEEFLLPSTIFTLSNHNNSLKSLTLIGRIKEAKIIAKILVHTMIIFERFEELEACMTLLNQGEYFEEYLIAAFISGLSEELQAFVYMLEPTSF